MSVLIFPFPPSLNHLFANGGKRGRVKAKPYQNWCAEADFQLMQQRPWPRYDGNVSVRITIGPPRYRGVDLDNVGTKAIFDRLTAYGIWADDKQVQSYSVAWSDDVKGAQVEIEGMK